MNRQIYIITGLMGSGKSTVTNFFHLRHYDVVNMDNVAKDIILNNSDAKVAMIRAFGKNVINEDSTYNMDYIKSVYFDPKYDTKREDFEHVLDYLIKEIFEQKDNKYFWSTEKDKVPLIIEIPSFNLNRFERFYRNFLGNIRYVINVTTDYKTRMDRLHARGLSDQEIEWRSRLQTDYSYPATQPDVARFCNIDNVGTIEELYDKVTVIMQQPDFFNEQIKEAIFHNYINNMPHFVWENMSCDTYYSSTGCESCPTPCANKRAKVNEVKND
jgi:dephospho-CoA kinase